MNYWRYERQYSDFSGIMPFLFLFMIIDLVLRGLALWKSAKKNQNIWFIALLVVNSMGILPLIYLLINRDQEVVKSKTKAKKSK